MSAGRGDLAQWMVEHADSYERVTGVRLFPGSLNVVLDHEWTLPTQRLRIEPAQNGGRVRMNIVPCTICGIDAFILRTDENEAGSGHHGREVLEIAAAVRLRDALHLEDGDRVDVTIGDHGGSCG